MCGAWKYANVVEKTSQCQSGSYSSTYYSSEMWILCRCVFCVGAVVVQASQVNGNTANGQADEPTQLAGFTVGAWSSSIAAYFSRPARIAL